MALPQVKRQGAGPSRSSAQPQQRLKCKGRTLKIRTRNRYRGNCISSTHPESFVHPLQTSSPQESDERMAPGRAHTGQRLLPWFLPTIARAPRGSSLVCTFKWQTLLPRFVEAHTCFQAGSRLLPVLRPAFPMEPTHSSPHVIIQDDFWNTKSQVFCPLHRSPTFLKFASLF